MAHKILDFIYLFLERGEGREKERGRNIDMQEKHQSAASCTPPTGDLAYDPGICPDRELNQQPFSLWDDTQPTEPHQSGSFASFSEAPIMMMLLKGKSTWSLRKSRL